MEDEPLYDVYLQPGESRLVSEPSLIRTILGSCVGVVFWHGRLGLGAMCHPMLPHCPEKSAAPVAHETGRRYVDFTIREMARQFDAYGVPRSEVIIKLFGGADVLPVHHGSKRATVGNLNCKAALRVVEEEGFAVAASRLGGQCGVNLRFNTVTGEVLVRKLC